VAISQLMNIFLFKKYWRLTHGKCVFRMDFPTNTSHPLSFCVPFSNVVKKSSLAPKSCLSSKNIHRTIAANRRVITSKSNARREPTKAWRIVTSDDQAWLTTWQRVRWTERTVRVFELCFMMELNMELLMILPRRATRSRQYIPVFTLTGSNVLHIQLSNTHPVDVNITYLKIWWTRTAMIMKPKGLHFSSHTNGSRHMAAAATTQVNQMRYNFMVRLKNNVWIIAMEETFKWWTENVPVMCWHTAGHAQNKQNNGSRRCKGAWRLRDGF